MAPGQIIDFTLDGGLNPGQWDFPQALASVSLTDPRPLFRRSLDADFNRPNSFGLSYHFLRRGPNSFLADNANADVDQCTINPNQSSCKKNTVGNLNSNLFYHVTDNLLFDFSSTYDVLDTRFIGFRATSKFLSFCECWTVTFALNQNVNPKKTSFTVNFNLLGLGDSEEFV